MSLLRPRTYICIRPEDGKCVHFQACGPTIGEEYEHDDPNWQPPKDWPYEVIDLRKGEESSKRVNERG
jgi:hypothetical protein